MFILFVIALIMMSFFIRLKVGTFRNPITIFSFFWVIVILFSKFYSSYLFEVSEKVYNFSYIFVLGVVFGYFCLASRFHLDSIDKNLINSNLYENKKNRKILIFFQIITLIILCYYLFRYNSIKKILPLYQLRIIRYEIGLLFNSGIELLFYNYIISSFVELIGLITIVKIIFSKKIDFLGILSLISLTVFSMIGLGRFGLFNTIFFILSTFFFKKISKSNDYHLVKNVNIRKKISRFFFPVLIILILIYIMTFIGATRMGMEINSFSDFMVYFNSSFEQAILYFTGPFRALDNYFTFKTNIYPINLYGRAFFSGFDELINFFLSYIGISFDSANSIITNLTNDMIIIGNGVEFNAFYTGILNAYLDGGLWGVVIFSILLGSIASYIWNFHIKHLNLYSFSLLVYFSLVLISTSYRLELQQAKTYIVILALWILAMKERSKI